MKRSPTSIKPKPPSARRYREEMIQIAIMRCPPIVPCGWCGWPVVVGYLHFFCDSPNPERGEPPPR